MNGTTYISTSVQQDSATSLIFTVTTSTDFISSLLLPNPRIIILSFLELRKFRASLTSVVMNDFWEQLSNKTLTLRKERMVTSDTIALAVGKNEELLRLLTTFDEILFSRGGT